MKRPKLWEIVILLALALAACRKPASPQEGPLPVNVVTAVEKEVQDWDEFTGRMEAVESVEIRPRVSGYITEIKFKAGAEVKKGDLLFVIDPRPYQADFDRAAAQFEQAQAQLKIAEIDFNRAKELRTTKVIAPQEFDQKAATAQQAAAAARAEEAAKQAAALNLEFTQIRSPIDGRVSDERVTLGNLVQPGAGAESVLTTVVSIDPMYVKIDSDENTVLKYVKRKTPRDSNLPAFVELENETGFPHEGHIDFVDNRLDPATGTLRVRIVLKTWEPLLSPGFFVRARIAGEPPYRAVLINDSAIGTDQTVKYVLVVGQDNKVEYRPVKLGPVIDGLRVVREGLKANDTIVVNGLQRVRPGSPVTPQNVAMGESNIHASKTMYAQNSGDQQ